MDEKELRKKESYSFSAVEFNWLSRRRDGTPNSFKSPSVLLIFTTAVDSLC